MRDLRKGRKLGRVKNQREALLKSLAVNLIMHNKIKTTTPKAKELRPFIERLVSYAKNGGVLGVRQVKQTLSMVAAEKLVKEIAPRYVDRKGGYTRIIKGLRRTGDAAEISVIEFI
ncbi:MAG: 50S ribosomal protein L17 [Patescibacteria group bacterium]